MKLPENVQPELPEIYYEGHSQTYWIQDAVDHWMKINEGSVKRELKHLGFNHKSEFGSLTDVDRAIMRIQKEHHVRYTGGLAGFPAGPIRVNGGLVLVTSEADVIAPAEGEWPLLESVISRMFGEHDVYFYAWCKMAYQCLYTGQHRPGQILALCGPKQCGKTFLQRRVIHYLLGGRSGMPYRYLIGDTTFNSEFFETEHLQIGDEATGTDIRTRRAFGKELKKIAAERAHSCHRKGVPAFTMEPYWRCSITLNPDSENLLVLPPLEESMKDKILLLSCACGQMPMPTRTSDDEARFNEAIYKELPAFCAWLLDIEIPTWMVGEDGRYGFTAYQDPELMIRLEEHSPEEKLWDLCVHVLGRGEKLKHWKGSTSELEEVLTMSSDAAKKLFTFGSACGMYLQRLAEKGDDRIVRGESRGTWELNLREE